MASIESCGKLRRLTLSLWMAAASHVAPAPASKQPRRANPELAIRRAGLAPPQRRVFAAAG